MEEQIMVKPKWLVQHIRNNDAYESVRNLVAELQLHTVCESADCPNIGECFGHKTATFLILGGVCTRACRYCAVPKGHPDNVDEKEPLNLASAVLQLGLKHVVITSVTRDDLPYGGAEQFVASIEAVRQCSPDTSIEVLIPDFRGNVSALNMVLRQKPRVFNHNLETVPRLYPVVRPIAQYEQSLDILRFAADAKEHPLVKSGIMVGLGETEEEVNDLCKDLYSHGVNILTIGQYLCPSKKHIAVKEYVTPRKFEMYKKMAEAAGIEHVVSGPLVRSSYHAGLMVDKCRGV